MPLAYKHVERSELLRTVLLCWRLHPLDKDTICQSVVHMFQRHYVSSQLCMSRGGVLGTSYIHMWQYPIWILALPKHDAQHVPVNQP